MLTLLFNKRILNLNFNLSINNKFEEYYYCLSKLNCSFSEKIRKTDSVIEILISIHNNSEK